MISKSHLYLACKVKCQLKGQISIYITTLIFAYFNFRCKIYQCYFDVFKVYENFRLTFLPLRSNQKSSYKYHLPNLKDPCSEFSKVGILHVRPVEGHFWSPRSPKGKKFSKKKFWGVKLTSKNFFGRPVG